MAAALRLGTIKRALFVSQRVGRDAHRRAYDRQPRGHRFEDRTAEPFVQARKDEHVGIAIELRERCLIDAGNHVDSVAESPVGTQTLPTAPTAASPRRSNVSTGSHEGSASRPRADSECPSSVATGRRTGDAEVAEAVRAVAKNSAGTPCARTAAPGARTHFLLER